MNTADRIDTGEKPYERPQAHVAFGGEPWTQANPFMGRVIPSSQPYDKPVQLTEPAYQKLLKDVLPGDDERLTLRDRFAMAALTGLLAGPENELGHVDRAEFCYEQAEAMTRARKS